MNELVVADVGNSATKLAIVRDERVVVRFRVGHGEPSARERLRRFIHDLPGAAPVIVVTVAPERSEELLEEVAPRRVAVAGRDFPALVSNECDPPEGVGRDRLFTASGALALAAAPFVVVDAGTAVTVDLVLPPARFAGGAILPGVRLGFGGLAREASRLPLLEAPLPDQALPLPGRNTDEAVRAGVVVGTTEAAAGVASRLAPSRAPRFLCGGDGPLLARWWPGEARLEPDLLFLGAARAFLAAEGAR